jgi:preprotein translocase subunit SecA
MFEGMMLRFQEDTARHLFRMQIIGPDGQPIESPEQLALAQAATQAAAEQQALAAARQQSLPLPAPVVPTRAPSTTIDALEREFQKKKERELERSRQYGAAKSADSAAGPRRTGEKVGRNDRCPCGSGKKYKNCHGAAETTTA